MTQPTTRHILIVEDEDDFRDILVRSRHELGIRDSDELHNFGNSRDVKAFLDGLGRAVDIAVLDLVLNEKPSIAYIKIKYANQLEGIELFEKYGEFFRKKIFITSAGNYRKAAEKGFNFNRPDIQVCLKTNPYEAPEEERFPNNLIRAIKNVYAALDEEDAGQGETRDD